MDGYSGSAYGGSRGKDPVVPWAGSGSRVDRGGCFNAAASIARSADRNDYTPEDRGAILGLRPAKSITP
jgi:formylglycine-generating enzyme required for sulfatase activity